MTSTQFDDLPLHYKHPSQQGTLVMSFAVDDNDEVIDGYFWAIQLDSGEVSEHATVKTLKKLDTIRNQFIGDGWRRTLPPKVVTKENAELSRKQRRAKAKIDKKSKIVVNSDARRDDRRKRQAEERKIAFAKLKEQVAKSTF